MDPLAALATMTDREILIQNAKNIEELRQLFEQLNANIVFTTAEKISAPKVPKVAKVVETVAEEAVPTPIIAIKEASTQNIVSYFKEVISSEVNVNTEVLGPKRAFCASRPGFDEKITKTVDLPESPITWTSEQWRKAATKIWPAFFVGSVQKTDADAKAFVETLHREKEARSSGAPKPQLS